LPTFLVGDYFSRILTPVPPGVNRKVTTRAHLDRVAKPLTLEPTSMSTT